MAQSFRAYHVAVIRMAQGITAPEAYHCWRRGLELGAVLQAVLEMRRIGMTRGPIVKHGRPAFGALDTRLNPAADRRNKKTKRAKLEPKWLRDIPAGGFEGLQEQLKAQRAGNAAPGTDKAGQLERKLNRQIAAVKAWDED